MQIDLEEIAQAVKALKKGQIIAYPTEAVYGLGCDPFNVDAISELLKLKHRSIYKGFILVAADWRQVEPLVEHIEPAALAQVFSTWPGPVTWVFPAKADLPQWINGRKGTLAIRVSAHPVVQALCQAFGGPIISTSANVEGQPPARDPRTVKMAFDDKIALVLNGSVAKQAKPTEIRDALTGEILRPA